MSQIDKVNYLPIVVWFLILFCILYIFLFIYILPLLFSSLKVRIFFFNQLLNDCFDILGFRHTVPFFFKGGFLNPLIIFLYRFLLSFIFLESFHLRLKFFLCYEGELLWEKNNN